MTIHNEVKFKFLVLFSIFVDILVGVQWNLLMIFGLQFGACFAFYHISSAFLF